VVEGRCSAKSLLEECSGKRFVFGSRCQRVHTDLANLTLENTNVIVFCMGLRTGNTWVHCIVWPIRCGEKNGSGARG